ncbi:MAG TPA: DUF167 domain-containing protein [Acidimicrobiales bacterium]
MTVHVHPRASHPRQVWDGTRLELWIHQPPVDGAANNATVDAVAGWLGLPRRTVSIVSGHASRTKVVAVEGVTALPPPDLVS